MVDHLSIFKYKLLFVIYYWYLTLFFCLAFVPMQKLIAADSFEYSMVEFTVEIILLGIMVGFSTSCAILFAAFVLTIMIIQLWPSYGNFIIVQELNLHLVAIIYMGIFLGIILYLST